MTIDRTEPEKPIMRRGVMFVLSSPSGAGKSTIAQVLLKTDPDLKLSISATTRPRRSSEVDGVHYHFVSKQEFEKLIDEDGLLEWAEVHGNLYGTPRSFVEEHLQEGRDVLFDIDVQGTQQLRDKMANDIATLFILPPSLEEMKARLHRRAEDTEEAIQKRLKTATYEMERWVDYDYLIVNEDLDKALNEARTVLAAERLRQRRQSGNASLAKNLYNDLMKATSSKV